MTRRLPSREERELFDAVLGDAKPLKGRSRPKVHAQDAKKQSAPKAELPQRTVSVGRTGPTGVDGRTAERLRRGLLEPDAKLDLHGLTEAVAHRALITFVKGAHTRGLRFLLVVTGKGTSQNDRDGFDLRLDRSPRGILNEMTPRWLMEPGVSEIIADVRAAHRRHGGKGALYVYLRKRER
jgi:DNA-nicking Smr family endonuclease